MEKLEHRLPWFLTIGAIFLYLSVPAAKYNFDGVACAIAVDLGDLRHLVHGNHLGYGILGYGWFSVWKLLGYRGPAIFVLQMFSSLLGAGAIGAFVVLMRRCGMSPIPAALAAAGLMVSEFYWVWSLESQVYPLGAFFLFWAAAEAFQKKPRPVVLGMLHAGAVLGHVGHIMFAPVAIYLLPRRWEDQLRYGASFTVTVLAAYLAAAAFCIQPKSWEDIRIWLLGSAALTLDRSFSWHGGYSLANLWHWLRLSIHMWGGGALVGLTAIALAGYGVAAAPQPYERMVKACLIWLSCYAVLYVAWEPYTPVYRVTDLAPLWLLIGMAVTRRAEPSARLSRFREVGLALGVLCLGAWNLTHVIVPDSDPQNNSDLRRALWVARETPENSWVVASGIDQVYLPYFAHRKTINIHYYANHEAVLEDHLKARQRAGDPIFIVLKTMPSEWQRWFASHMLKEMSRDQNESLYRIGAL